MIAGHPLQLQDEIPSFDVTLFTRHAPALTSHELQKPAAVTAHPFEHSVKNVCSFQSLQVLVASFHMQLVPCSCTHSCLLACVVQLPSDETISHVSTSDGHKLMCPLPSALTQPRLTLSSGPMNHRLTSFVVSPSLSEHSVANVWFCQSWQQSRHERRPSASRGPAARGLGDGLGDLLGDGLFEGLGEGKGAGMGEGEAPSGTLYL